MLMRIYVVAFAVLYFWLWGHFSNWDIDHALFVDWDVHWWIFDHGMGTFMRLSIGAALFLAAIFSVATIERLK